MEMGQSMQQYVLNLYARDTLFKSQPDYQLS